jgi:cytochrome oxidase Cu insertion factor (SCO1/SenC/PrrC family)
LKIDILDCLMTAAPKNFPPRNRIHTCARLLAVIVILALSGCEKNTSTIATTRPDYGGGSYAATNTADCLPDTSLVDQYGHKFSLASLRGKPVLIDFIYTGCTTACPLLTAKFAQIAKTLGPRLGKDVTLVSITIDPEHDHPAELLKYARLYQADYRGWLFLGGRPKDIDTLLHAFNLRRERDKDGTIAHVATAFLLDSDGRQARLYNALEVLPRTVVADTGRELARG